MEKTIKLLWVTNALEFGGSERQLINIGSKLMKLNYKIDLFYYYEGKNEFKQYAEKAGFNIVLINKDKSNIISFVITVMKFIKKNKYDIVHAFGGGTANIYGRLPAVLAGKPIVVGAMKGKRHFVKRSIRIVNSFINIFANHWTINNMDLKPILLKQLRFTNGDRVKLLNNGYVSESEIDYKYNEITDYDSIKKSKVVFITIGRLVDVKNHMMFLECAKTIAEQDYDAEFWLIGDGKYYDKYKNWISDNNLSNKIKMFGYRSDIDVGLSRSTIYVQTSSAEGSPNTVAEALRAGKPVLCTNCTNLDDFIIEGVNGYSIQLNDRNFLVDKMEELLKLPEEELLKMGEISKEMFNNTFLSEEVIKEFDMYYKQLLSK